MKWEAELAIAIELAKEAGRAILPIRKTAKVSSKAGGEPVTEADMAANRIILAGLKNQFPGDAILSEETPSDPVRLRSDRIWIIDPIDGTKEFITGTDDFAVQIGFVAGGVPVVGVVNQVSKGRLFSSALGTGAWVQDPETGKNRQRLKVSGVQAIHEMKMTVSRWHRSKKQTAILEIVRPREILPAGSIGVKVGMVAIGEADLYLHPSKGTAEWDTCAPDAIIHEAGGMLTDFAGKRLLYNQAAPLHTNGLACSNGRSHAAVLHLISGTVKGFGFEP